MHLGLQEVDGKRASMPLKEIGYRLIRTFENTNKKRPERGVFTELMAEWTGNVDIIKKPLYSTVNKGFKIVHVVKTCGKLTFYK